MSDLLNDPVFLNMNPDEYRRFVSMVSDSAISPLSDEPPQVSTFNSMDGQESTTANTLSDHDESDGSPKRRLSSLSSKIRLISAYMKHHQSSLVNGLPSSPGHWPSYDAACDDKNPRDPSSVQKERNSARSPSSDKAFNNSVIREVIGTRKIYRTGESEYLVHWAGYPRGQISWVSQDIIQPIAEHQIMFFECERRLLCYKGSHGEIFTRKNAPQCEEGDELGCVGCARCGRGCN